jgi:DNA-binding NtrC family response regulator/tetratricopeptide (TPR) repeat protein
MDSLAEIAGISPGIAAVREQVRRVLARQFGARRPPPLLLRGETGTGKGLLARACHQAGPRAGGPFVVVNCAAIPESLIEAELFGFERGAFTGAGQAKSGLFQSARGGTILLDEIGLLAGPLQAKLLTFLDDRVVRRLGSTRAEPIDVWVMAATSTDLDKAVRDGRFREDLYHRLAVLSIELPPLRARQGDVLLLADRFLAQACRDYGLHPKALTAEARAAILRYPWPGNVRELANVIERATLLSDGSEIHLDVLALPGLCEASPPVEGPPDPALAELPEVAPDRGGYYAALDLLKRAQIVEALTHTAWNVARAAERLGVPRNTLRYRMARLGLKRETPEPVPRRARAGISPRPTPETAEPGPSASYRVRAVAFLRVSAAPPGGATATLSTGVPHWLDLAVEKIQAFGGHVLARDLDRIDAAFGLTPAEDAPALAAGAALAIRRLGTRAQARSLVVDASCAIDTIACRVDAADEPARPDPAVLDHARQHLDVLMQGADAGTIVVGAAAAPFLQRHFVLDDAATGAVEKQSLVVRRDEAGVDHGVPLVVSHRSPFLGRAQEIAFLERRLQQVATTGRGHIVGLMGEPGMGKSRLLAELREVLSTHGVPILVGRCASHSTNLPYSLFIDLVRQAWRLDDGDVDEELASTVKSRLASVGLEEHVPEILALLGVPPAALAVLSPEAVRGRIFEALRRLLLAHAHLRALALLLEDLHWADSTSQQFLAALADCLPGAPLLVITTMRPGYRASWLDRSWTSQLALPPLSLDDSRSIVRALRPELAAASIDAIARRAEGNPFFLEELAGTIGPGDAVEGMIPTTVTGALHARIDRLPLDARRVLETAAVLGREAPIALLEVIMDAASDDLAPALATLVAAEFMYEQPGGSFVFKHALTQEVAYARIAPAERLRLHAVVGRALESQFAGRLDENLHRLAHHWARTDDHARAVDYLRRLADRAVGTCAPTEALAALEQALEKSEQLPEGQERERTVLRIVTEFAFPLMVLGRIEEAKSFLLRYQARVERLDDPTLAGPFFATLAFPHDHTGEHRQAEVLALRALAMVARSGDVITTGKAFVVLTHSSLWAGRFAEGVERAARAVEALTAPGSASQWLGVALWVKAHHEVLMGDFDAGLGSAEALWTVGQRSENRHSQSVATCLRGWVAALRLEAHVAVELCDKALELADSPITRAIVLGYLGEALHAATRYDDARQALAGSVGLFRQIDFPQCTTWNLTRLSLAELGAGNVDKAKVHADEAISRARAIEFPFGEALARRALGLLAQADAQPDPAVDHLTTALEMFARMEARYHEAVVRLDLAGPLTTIGARDIATRHLAAAAATFNDLTMPVCVERTITAARELGLRRDSGLSPRG